uniref:Plastocyanin-like domain-containing protein n=1 Tax=Populus trichocarpa TaxID=3694 RepID=A0A2K1YYX4_POPTR
MQWTAQTLQLCLVQVELMCFKSGTKLKLFLTFLSINYQKAGGGFSPIRVNNRKVLSVPLPKPEDEFDLLIGDWNSQSHAQGGGGGGGGGLVVVVVESEGSYKSWWTPFDVHGGQSYSVLVTA